MKAQLLVRKEIPSGFVWEDAQFTLVSTNCAYTEGEYHKACFVARYLDLHSTFESGIIDSWEPKRWLDVELVDRDEKWAWVKTITDTNLYVPVAHLRFLETVEDEPNP